MCFFYKNKSKRIHLDLNSQPLASQADALSITYSTRPNVQLCQNQWYLFCLLIVLICKYSFFGNKLNNLNKWNSPSLNTQSCLWCQGISVFGPFGQPDQYIKKSWGPIMSNFWGHYFHVFGVKIFFLIFFVNPIASKLKSCIIDFKK